MVTTLRGIGEPSSVVYARMSTTDPVATAELTAVNSGPQLNATVWILTSISTVFMALRLYAKIWRRRRLWWDDYILAAGWVSVPIPQGEKKK